MSLFSGIAHAIGNIFHPAQKPQQKQAPQQQHNPIYDIGHFLQTHAITPPVPQIKKPAQIKIPSLTEVAVRSIAPPQLAHPIAQVVQPLARPLAEATSVPSIARTIGGAVAQAPGGEKLVNNAFSQKLTGGHVSPLTVRLKQNPVGTALDIAGGIPAFSEAGAPIARGVANEARAGFPQVANQVGAVGKDVSKISPRTALKVAQQEQKVAGNKFTQGVKASPEVSPQVQAAVSGQHTVRNTAELANTAELKINNLGIKRATQKVHDALAVPDGQIDDNTVAQAIKVAKMNDSRGDHDTATSVYDALSAHLVKAGQTVQAASLLARRTPEGLQFAGQKALKKAGVELTPEIKNAMQAALKEIRATADNSPERDYAAAKFQQLIGKQIPSSNANKALGIWKAGLLSGAKTQGGNFLSNGTFGVLKGASNPLAVGLDKVISIGTGQRTKTLTGRGLLSGTGEGIQKGFKTLKTGIDERNIGADKYQHTPLNFKNPVLNKYVNGIFSAMSAGDQPFYYSSLKNNLYDLAGAAGKNQKLRGAELDSFINDFVKDPPKAQFQVATDAAEKAVLGQDSALSRGVTKAAKAIPGGQVIVPFTKVPTNFLERTLDFTPLGGAKGIGKAIMQIKKGSFDQRALVESVSEATTGTGVILIGAELAQHGLLSGSYPNDPKEQARWKAEGITPNSVNIGGTWYSLNYLGPVGLLFGAGKNYVEAAKNNDSPTMQAIAGLGQGLQQQSFLQGLSGFSDAIKDPGRYGANLARSQAGSLVPSFVNDIGNTLDPYQRDNTGGVLGAGNAIKARIPLARNTLPTKQDAFGRDLKQAAGSGLATALNPLKPSKSISTPLTNEVDRLKGTGKDNFVFPTTEKTLSAGGKNIKLDQAQQRKWNQTTGQATEQLWNKVIQAPGYSALTDDKKAEALRDAATDINAVEKVRFLQSMGEPQVENMRAAYDSLSKTQKALVAQSGYDPQAYIAKQQPKIAKAKKTKRPYIRTAVGHSMPHKIKIGKAPTIKFKSAKIAKSPTIHLKRPKGQYAKLPKVSRATKKVKILA